MIKAILTDIEGTTTSLAFVKDVLFPYAWEYLPVFLEERGGDPIVRELIAEVRAGSVTDLDQQGVIKLLRSWMEQDQKIAPLKKIQGLIWEDGYRRGDFIGHVYADAARRLREWRQQGLVLGVYSSGSVQAQQLLFAHTEFGDLSPLFSCFFDTAVGHKREVQSYRIIAEAMKLPTEQILFLSDVLEELDAARHSGMRTVWLIREGFPVLASQPSHIPVRDFDGIDI